MQNYLNDLRYILENGQRVPNRTGIDTISVFGMQARYNLNAGFPAMTTKYLAWKPVVSELLWFIEGSGDERRLCEILHGTRSPEKKTIWTANAQAAYWKPKAKFEGDLQKVYGYQWRKWSCYSNWESSTELVKQVEHKGENKPFNITFDIEHTDYTDADDFVGKVFATNGSGDIKVLKKLPTRNSNTYYKIQFLSGINTIIECSRPSIKSGTIANPYRMSAVNGNGCYGIIDKRSPYMTRAYNLWLNMMERCHGSDPVKTIYYKQRGIFVESEWRCFSNFYRDIHGLVGFDHWVSCPSKFDLDKDYFGNNFYGQKSTIFLPASYNQLLSHNTVDGKLYIATNKKTGEVFKFTSPIFFNKHTKTSGMVDRAFLNQNGETQNWIFKKIEAPSGYAWRQKFYVDQLLDLIEGIKKDPHGRRHILSAWNPGELSDMALPPCHIMAQFSVTNGKLNCLMYQRSNDFFLGCPFNIASYSLLTHMIAQVCGLDVGEFIHTNGDTHIYVNHLDQVHEQLSRTPHALPTLWMNPEITDITKFTMDDIKLLNYTSEPAIKAEMAV